MPTPEEMAKIHTEQENVSPKTKEDDTDFKPDDEIKKAISPDPVSEPSDKGSLAPLRKGILGKRISEGSHADIHEINKLRENSADLVVKIDKTTEYSPPVFNFLKMNFPREKISKILEKTLGPQFKISPDMDFIKNGVAEYLLMKKYFAVNDKKEAQKNDDDESIKIRKELISDLQNKDSAFHKEMLSILGDEKLTETSARVLDQQLNENFLPKEQVVVGHPPEVTQAQAKEYAAKQKKLPFTYYILQERIKGADIVPLSELNDKQLTAHPELLKKLLAFAMLTKKMYWDTGKLIDTRPEEVGKHPFEWFQQTANILADKSDQKLFFVDTRWLWDKKSRLGAKGINIVDQLGVRSVNRAIKKYATLLSRLNENQ